jgi:hypothetical protein
MNSKRVITMEGRLVHHKLVNDAAIKLKSLLSIVKSECHPLLHEIKV